MKQFFKIKCATVMALAVSSFPSQNTYARLIDQDLRVPVLARPTRPDPPTAYNGTLRNAYRAANGIELDLPESIDQTLIQTNVENYLRNQFAPTTSVFSGLASNHVDYLRTLDADFQSAMLADPHVHSRATFVDTIRRGEFCGNPVLIRLDPPDEWFAKANMKESVQSFVDADTDLRKLEDSVTQALTFQNTVDSAIDSSVQDSSKLIKEQRQLSNAVFDANERVQKCNTEILNLKRRERQLRHDLKVSKSGAQRKKISSKLDACLKDIGVAQSKKIAAVRECNDAKDQKVLKDPILSLRLKQLSDFRITQQKNLDIAKLNQIISRQSQSAAIDILHKLGLTLNDAKQEFRTSGDTINVGSGDEQTPITYLLVLNYNIPALRSQLAPCKFRSARYCSQLQLRWFPESDKALLEGANYYTLQDELLYKGVSVQAIYPKNLVLDANFSNSKSLTVTAQPEWAGISAGSVAWQNTDNIAYPLKFPTVVGSASNAGALQWVFYPAKVQNISFGNQNALVVFTVPRKYVNGVLQLNNMLKYDFKYFHLLPYPFPSVERSTLYVPLNQALCRDKDIELFKRTHGRMLSAGDQMALERILRLRDPAEVSSQPKTDSTPNYAPTMVKVEVPPKVTPVVAGSATLGAKMPKGK